MSQVCVRVVLDAKEVRDAVIEAAKRAGTINGMGSSRVIWGEVKGEDCPPVTVEFSGKERAARLAETG